MDYDITYLPDGECFLRYRNDFSYERKGDCGNRVPSIPTPTGGGLPTGGAPSTPTGEAPSTNPADLTQNQFFYLLGMLLGELVQAESQLKQLELQFKDLETAISDCVGMDPAARKELEKELEQLEAKLEKLQNLVKSILMLVKSLQTSPGSLNSMSDFIQKIGSEIEKVEAEIKDINSDLNQIEKALLLSDNSLTPSEKNTLEQFIDTGDKMDKTLGQRLNEMLKNIQDEVRKLCTLLEHQYLLVENQGHPHPTSNQPAQK